MSSKEFWMATYLAAINYGHSPKVAQGIAQDAVEHLEAEWPWPPDTFEEYQEQTDE